MAIARVGTGTQVHNGTAASTETVTLPSAVPAGAIIIIGAFWATTGSWGSTPAGWVVVPNTTQTASTPAVIAYYAFQTAAGLSNPTVTGPGSAANSIVAFAYSGTMGVNSTVFDADTVLRNGASTTISFTAASPTQAQDMAVIIGGQAAGSSNVTAGSTPNGFSLYLNTAGTSTGVADKQLASSGSVGSTNLTVSVSGASDGIMLTLIPMLQLPLTLYGMARRKRVVQVPAKLLLPRRHLSARLIGQPATVVVTPLNLPMPLHTHRRKAVRRALGQPRAKRSVRLTTAPTPVPPLVIHATHRTKRPKTQQPRRKSAVRLTGLPTPTLPVVIRTKHKAKTTAIAKRQHVRAARLNPLATPVTSPALRTTRRNKARPVAARRRLRGRRPLLTQGVPLLPPVLRMSHYRRRQGLMALRARMAPRRGWIGYSVPPPASADAIVIWRARRGF